MPKQLTIDEMLEAASQCELPEYDHHVQAIETAAQALADDLAKHLEVECGAATWEGLAFAGVCAAFSPKTPDQPIPECIEEFDEGGDWVTREEFTAEMASIAQSINRKDTMT